MRSPSDVLARLRQASKSYGKVRALDGVDLALHGGELLALLGPNGAGKTTAIGLLLGLVRADAGTVDLFGRDPQSLEARRHIGVMLQAAQLPATLRVGELVRLAASYYPAPRTVQESADLAGVADLLKRPYGACSSRSRSAAARNCCSSTSPPSAWTSTHARTCGPQSAISSPKAMVSCSRRTTWKKPRRLPTACA